MIEKVTLGHLIRYYSKSADDMSDCKNTRRFLNIYYDSNRGEYQKKEYVKLAYLMESKLDGELNEVTDDVLLYFSFKLLGISDCYEFINGIKANVNVYNPFVIDGNRKLVSEKWHLLISVLAYWDIANNQQVTSKLMQVVKSRTYKKGKKLDFNYNLFQNEECGKNWYISDGFYFSYVGLKLWMAEVAGIDIRNIVDTAISKIESGDNMEAYQIIHNGINIQQILNNIRKEIVYQ